MRLVLIARHGESALNVEHRINGDPSVPVRLSEAGRKESRFLGEQIAHVPIDVCFHTRFGRTVETSELALEGRDVPLQTEPLLDDIDVGELEGQTIDDYRAWKRKHTRADPFPGGESLDDAARRYALAFRKMLDGERRDHVVLVICHEIPLRYTLNGAAGSEQLDGPTHDVRNATAYLFDERALVRAVERIEQLAR
jgi:broad specificity phosphatase PhoE